MKYRKEIDGLRAVAVVPVIMFHAGIPAFSGGYVGVDIFFVISGYLITSILLSEIRQEKFSFITFYERRARRILPALFLTLLLTFVVGWIILLPHQLKTLAESAISVLLFSANIFFWNMQDYFSPTNELQPLLHTWSLAVEEQYYIIMPILLVTFRKVSHYKQLVFFFILTLLSLIICESVYPLDSSMSFYFIHTRAWEMLLGSLAAYTVKDIKAVVPLYFWWHEALSFLGLCLIFYSIFTFDSATIFPGIRALFPCLGTLLLLLFCNDKTWTGKTLSWKPFITIGLISYSAYLLHQPIFAFYRTLEDIYSWPLDIKIKAFLIISIFIFSYLSWRFVEAPFRTAMGVSRKLLFNFSILGALILAAVASIYLINNGFPNRKGNLAYQIRSYASVENHRFYRLKKCQLDKKQVFSDYAQECFTENSSLPKITLVGDSIMSGFHSGFNDVFKTNNVQQLTFGGCPPILGYTFHKDRPTCEETLKATLKYFKESNSQILLLAANWFYYSIESNENSRLLSQTIQDIKKSKPRAKIGIIGSLPQWKFLPKVLAQIVKEKKDIYLASDHYDDLKAKDKVLSHLALENQVTFISVLDLACPDNLCPVLDFNGDQMYIWAFDSNHLTHWASVQLARKIRDSNQSLFTY